MPCCPRRAEHMPYMDMAQGSPTGAETDSTQYHGVEMGVEEKAAGGKQPHAAGAAGKASFAARQPPAMQYALACQQARPSEFHAATHPQHACHWPMHVSVRACMHDASTPAAPRNRMQFMHEGC
eukprot:365012-Chlamydomonas_euryale.AAC.5